MPITYRKGRLLKTIRSCCKRQGFEGLECYGVVTQQRQRDRVPKHTNTKATLKEPQTAPRTKYCCLGPVMAENITEARIKDRMLPLIEKAKRKLVRLVRSL